MAPREDKKACLINFSFIYVYTALDFCMQLSILYNCQPWFVNVSAALERLNEDLIQYIFNVVQKIVKKRLKILA